MSPYFKSGIQAAERHQQWLPIGLILLAAVALRLYQLSTESLWIDEMLSIDDAKNFKLTIPYIRPFYFMLLHGWMQLGASDAWLRGFSVIFGVGTVFLTYQLGRRTVGQSTGLIAAFVLAVSPLWINHAQEIRMYTLIPFLSVGGTLALTYAFERPTYLSLVWWVVTRTALLLTNANNVLLLLPDMVLGGWKFRNESRSLLRFGMGLGGIGLFFLPVLYSLLIGGESEEFMKEQVADYSKPGLLQIIGMLTQITVYWPLRHLLESNAIALERNELSDSSLLSHLLSVQAASLIFYGIVTLVLIGLLGLGFGALLDRSRSERLLWIGVWALLPTLAMLGVSYTQNSIWFPRYLLFVGPYWLILMATGFVVLWHWRRSLAIGVAIAAIVALSGGLKDYYTTLYRNDWKGATALIQQNEQPGDVLVYYSAPRFVDYSLPRYYRGSLSIHPVNRPLEELETLPSAKSQTWLVCWLYCKDEANIKQILQTAAGENYKVQQHKQFKSLDAAPIEVFLATSEKQWTSE